MASLTEGRTRNLAESRIYLSSPHMSDEGYEMQYISYFIEKGGWSYCI